MNNVQKLQQICGCIRPADRDVVDKVKQTWDHKCMPLGSLGLFQDTVSRVAGMQKTVHPSIDRKLTIVMAADNGVVEEGVSQSDFEVTTQVVANMLQGKATIAIMSSMQGSDFMVVDMGMKQPVAGVVSRSLMRGTRNMTKTSAMDYETAAAAICTGAELAMQQAAKGYRLLSTGEMGIGNTTTSTAVLSVLSGQPAARITGRGAGLSTEGLHRKTAAILKAIEVNQPDAEDPVDVLAKVGGLDLAGLTGVFLGAAAAGVPVVIDGFIASVAALAACRIVPEAKDYMIASHASSEPGAVLAARLLGLRPVIFGEMHLGEGSGALLLFSMLDHVFNLYEQMPSFEEGNIESYIRLK